MAHDNGCLSQRNEFLTQLVFSDLTRLSRALAAIEINRATDRPTGKQDIGSLHFSTLLLFPLYIMPQTKKKKTSRQNAYIGKAGQLAVMAELALRGYIVALPEIDKGDDIFVVNFHTGKLWRLQVKGATLQSRKNSDYQVVIDEDQIQRKPKGDGPDLHFVFALRVKNSWRFVVMPRQTLWDYIDCRAKSMEHKGIFGHLEKEAMKLRRTLGITIKKSGKSTGEFWCSFISWETHMEAWGEWPYLDHEAITANNADCCTAERNIDLDANS